MLRSHRLLSLFGIGTFGMLSAHIAQAQVRTNFEDVGLSSTDPITIILNIISWFLGITALIAVVLVLYGGFIWMTSNGNEEKIEKAKQVLKNAVIGLLIIMSAWGIVLYLISVFSDATGTSTTTGDGTGSSCRGCSIPTSGSTFGVLSTNPESSETDVVLCTDVTVRMTADIDQTSVNSSTFFVQVSGGKVAGASCSANNECASSVCSESQCVGDTLVGTIGFGPGDTTDYFNFVPDNSFEQDTTYEVTVAGGSTGVQSLDATDDGIDDSLSMSATYSWTFTTGSETDTTPPTVQINSSSPYPADGATDVCLNTVINFDFSEPMRITTFNDDVSFVVDDASAGVPDWTDGVALDGWSFGGEFDYAQARPDVELNPNNTYGVRLYGGDAINNFAGALTDSCGNALDGDADGTSEGSTVDNYVGYDAASGASEDPITWTTGENAECTPIITSFTPGADYYGEYAGGREGDSCSVNSDCASNSCVSNVCEGFGDTTLEITGMYLAPHPEVLMEGSQIFASDDFNTCFNQDHLGNVAGDASMGDNCLDDELQSDSTIVMRTPVGAASTTPIYVSVAGETSETSSSELSVLSPYISALSPDNGSVGQYVTVVGSNFGDDQGSGAVRMVSADGSRVSSLSMPDACGDVWTNETIIISAPETYTHVDGSTGDWESGDVAYIQVLNSSGKYSDLQEFTFNDVARPNLCQVVSSCDNTGGQSFYLTGDNFGGEEGDNRVAFASGESTGYYGSISSWSNERVDGATQSSMTQDEYWVSVYDAETGENSNAVQYEIPCSAAPQVLDITTCSPDEDLYPAPNPRPGSTDACINADIGVLFDQEMNPSTFTTSTITLEQFNSGESIDASYPGLDVFGRIQNPRWQVAYSGTASGFKYDIVTVPIDEDQDGVEDRATRSSNLRPNTWYQMTITTGVQSVEGVALAENYVLTFKTRDSEELCAVSTIAVDPSSSTQNTYWNADEGVPMSQEYSGSAYSEECAMLDAESYSWDWSIDNESVGNFGTGPDSTATQSVYVSGDDAENEGTASVTADVEGIVDDADFIVDLGYCETDADCASCGGSTCNESSNECTPVIQSISPSSGDHGTWVTLGGCMFGSDRGTVTMTMTDGTISTQTDWPDEALCGDTWTNESVIIEVPAQYDSNSDGSDDAELPENTYTFSLALPSGLSDTGEDEYALNDVAHPGLCLIDPDSGSEGDGVTAYGKGFGTTEGYASFHGVDDYDEDGVSDRVSSTDVAWSETEINAIIPSGASTGRSAEGQEGFVAITAGGDEQCSDSAFCSNPLDFVVSCSSDADCSSGVCDESGVCVVDDGPTCESDADCQSDACGIESTCSDSGYCTPVITSLEEASGPNGAATTVQGCYFGDYGAGSQVTFTNDSGLDSVATFPCVDSWSDTQIIVTVPDAADIPVGTTADVRVTSQYALTSGAEVFEVTNTCSNGAPVPGTGVPLLCDLFDATGRAGDVVEFSGGNQVSSGQSDVFFYNQTGESFSYTDATLSSATVPADAETGDAYISVNSCVSNGLEFAITCDTAADCGDGSYCVDGICTAGDTCGSCTVGTSDAVCGTEQGCFYDSSESGYCCGSRPTLESASLENGDTDVCPNSQFMFEFSEGMTNKSAITISKVVDNGDGTYSAVSSEALDIEANDDSTIYTVSLVSGSLDTATLYMLTIMSDEDATASHLNGISTGLSLLDGTERYVFTTATSTCAPDHIELLNDETQEGSYIFTEPSASVDFTAYMMSSDDQYLAPTDDMNWQFTWDPYYDDSRCDNIAWVDTSAEDDAETEAATSETQPITSGDEHDEVETITVTASAVSGWTGALSEGANVSTFYCQNGEAWEYIDESSHDSYVSHAYPQHFRLIYCDNDELPTLNTIVQSGSASDDWFLQYLFISPEDENDAFGIRVYENSNRLTPEAWYAANVPNPGDPQEITVDGYQAIQDGNSIYIAASNIDEDSNGDGLDELYSNIYLITFNESEAMADIQSQILEYIRFNWNLSYADCEGSDKEKLVRDTRRVTDLGEIASLANAYYETTGSYPYPQSESFGSYIEELTSSVWSSWQGALGNLLGSTLPTDPYNFFYAADADDPWNAGETPWEYTGEDTGVEDCAYEPADGRFFDETGSCWDPINNVFYCPEYSHTYLWKVDSSDTDNAQLYANLEYTSSTTETYINNLGSGLEPCSDVDADSTCSCFNFMMSSESDPGGEWQ